MGEEKKTRKKEKNFTQLGKGTGLKRNQTGKSVNREVNQKYPLNTH